MCGFIALFKNGLTEEDERICDISSKTIIHRGPDDSNRYVNENVLIHFNRLSIVDLEMGKQPFNYYDKYIIVFNGEIYNYREIRDTLKTDGYTFYTNSEIEVIASLYDKVGMDFVKSLRGMFSIYIYDKEKEKVVATRDCFGIKPLYYIDNDDSFWVASELKALINVNKELTYDPNEINNYLTFQYIPGYNTLFKEISQLPPGHIIEKKNGENVKLTKYIDLEMTPKSNNKEELKRKIVESMRESVKSHMISDVPVATFLSSGIDSSIITKLASEINPDIMTFTIGFDIDGYDESIHTGKFCEELGLKNEVIKMNYRDYVRELPKIIYHMDNPIADPSIIPLYHICNRVSKDYKVVLSGEGSDELFGGYNIYTEDNSIKRLQRLPKSIKKILIRISRIIPDNTRGKSFLERGCTELEERYVGNARIFSEKDKKKVLSNYSTEIDYRNVTAPLFNKVKHLDNVCKRQYIDLNTWLIGDILTKADRMSMANSLEVRVPFLDKEVFNLASTLSKDEKINGFTTKHMLRESFKDIIPEYVYKKKKLGYPVPIRVWLKSELYQWAYEIIKDNPVKEIKQEEVLRMLNFHRGGKGDYSRRIWCIIVYIIWYRLYIDKTLNKDSKFEV
ncbi:MAG: asparagine synthase (glutamine-hydrolyzing) [Clostridium sp.]